MTYIKLATMEWPFFQGDVDLEPPGAYAPLVINRPEFDDSTHKLVSLTPQEVNGEWRIEFSVEPLTAVDIAAKAVLTQQYEQSLEEENEKTRTGPYVGQPNEALNTMSGSVPDVIG
jgi:hypothetical protein